MKPALVMALTALTIVAWRDPAIAQQAPQAAENGIEFFEAKVRPVLAEHCLSCHGTKKQESSLRLDSREGLLAGGDSGAVVSLEKPTESRLLKAIRHEDSDLRMPPEPAAKLADTAIASIERWLERGAPWPASEPMGTARPSDAGASHWAFRTIARPAVPAVTRSEWPRTSIDRFVLARLEQEGMVPSEPADRATLVRRASFDLIGLPPSEEEIAALVNDPAEDAFARFVDRLLDSPHYGERWGRYWLDVARYADTKGYVRLQEERQFAYAFTYRDYVIRAFNEDLPFDRFIVEQLAADQLPAPVDRGRWRRSVS